MAVSCGAHCTNILSTSYALHIMMHFDNYYRSHDGVVLLNFLFLTVFYHYWKICANLTFSLWHSLQISDNSLVNAVLSSGLFFNHRFLKVIVVVCFSLFLVFVLVLQLRFCVFMGFEPAIEDK